MFGAVGRGHNDQVFDAVLVEVTGGLMVDLPTFRGNITCRRARTLEMLRIGG